MSTAPKYNFPKAEKVQVFEYVKEYNEHKYAADETLKQQIQELSSLVHNLQIAHNPASQTEALQILDAEFREIQAIDPTRWQTIQHQMDVLKRQLLNPERHLSASKATLGEIAKHYLDNSVVAKGALTYLETMSTEPSHGE